MRLLTKDLFLVSLMLLGVFFIILLLKFDLNFNIHSPIDPNKASQVASYITGTTGVIWGLASILFIYKSFELSKSQDDESKGDRVTDHFFILLDSLKQIVNYTEGEIYGSNILEEKAKGYQFYTQVLSHFKNTCDYKNTQFEYKHLTDKNPILIIPDAIPLEESNHKFTMDYLLWNFNRVYPTYQSQLGHFFRLVYNIINHVHSSKYLSQDEKVRLINLIQTQLNNDQLGLIFYNCLTGYDKFYKLLNDSYPNFLQNIDPKSLVRITDTEFYPNVEFRINEK